MQRRGWWLATAVSLFLAGAATAQQNPGTIAGLEFQRPKSGMVSQYEAGRKQKAAWHKQQNDPRPLYVWETLTGENTGTYIVGRLGEHWADMDKPPVPEEADRGEFQKALGNSVESIVAHYYEYMPKVSNPGEDSKTPTKYSEIVTFHVRYGKNADFNSAIAQVHEGTVKTKWPFHYLWYSQAFGGTTGTYVLVIPHNNFADFEEKPDVKPFRDMLKEAFGQAEADSIVNRIDESVQKETSEIVQFHPELSYIPGR